MSINKVLGHLAKALSPKPTIVAISSAAAAAMAAGEHVLVAPMTGECIPMQEVPDPLFACEALGGGVGIIPSEGRVVSPVNGIVMATCDTRHAISIKSDDGIEVLVHCGIDTVELYGSPFVVHVAQGDHVRAGQLLVDVDLDAIRAAGKDTVTPVIVTNQHEFASLEADCGRSVAAGDLLITLS